MTTYRMGITNRGAQVDAWVLDLPGCRVITSTIEAALELVSATIGEHLVWLKQHGEEVDLNAPIDFEVVEQVDSASEFCFKADLEPLTADEIETGIRRSGFAHADLMERANLPEAVLSYKPPISAVKIENYPDARTIREIYQHGAGSPGVARNVGDAEWAGPRAGGDQPDVEAAREAAFARLRSLPDADRARVFRQPNQRTGIDAEWSARKVLRRMINHERFHVKEIDQRLAWLLVGIPEVIPPSRE